MTTTNYYVSATGSDMNNGLGSGLVTPFTNKPFQSLGRAVYSLKTGDTIFMMNGVYSTGTSLFNFNGSPTNSTKILNYPGHSPVLELKYGGINIFSCSYLKIEGLTLIGNLSNITLSYAIQQQNVLNDPLTNSNGITIKPGSTGGVGNTTPHHILINGNIIRNFPGGGIAASDSDYITFSNNIVSGNAKYSPYGCQGITCLYAVNTDNSTGYKIVYSGNIAFDNQSLVPWVGSGKITEGHGIMLDTTQQSRDGTLYLGRSKICNNISYSNGSSGIQAYKTSNVDILNNTCYHNGCVLTNCGEIDVTYSTNGYAADNIMVATPGQNGNIIHYSTNVNYINNLVYNTEPFQASDKVGGTQPFNLLGVDPLFCNESNYDFRLTPPSKGIQSDGSKWGYEGIIPQTLIRT